MKFRFKIFILFLYLWKAIHPKGKLHWGTCQKKKKNQNKSLYASMAPDKWIPSFNYG